MSLDLFYIWILQSAIVICGILNTLVFIRVLVSWFVRGGVNGSSSPVLIFLKDVTDPVINFVRKNLPHKYGMMDLSALVALISLDLLSYFLNYLLISFVS